MSLKTLPHVLGAGLVAAALAAGSGGFAHAASASGPTPPSPPRAGAATGKQ